MIYYNEEFYDTVECIKEEFEDDDYSPNDWEVEITHCNEEPIMPFGREQIEYITEQFCEERDTEDGDYEQKAIELIMKHIDFDAINKEMPKLWYPNGRKETVNLKEI